MNIIEYIGTQSSGQWGVDGCGQTGTTESVCLGRRFPDSQTGGYTAWVLSRGGALSSLPASLPARQRNTGKSRDRDKFTVGKRRHRNRTHAQTQTRVRGVLSPRAKNRAQEKQRRECARVCEACGQSPRCVSLKRSVLFVHSVLI